jgi:hypothetical protein
LGTQGVHFASPLPYPATIQTNALVHGLIATVLALFPFLLALFLRQRHFPSAAPALTPIDTMMSQGRWGGLPATLLRKVTVVENLAATGQLPVHKLTFANPTKEPSLGIRLDYGEVVKVEVPGFKPKSYSMSGEDREAGTFDVTVKVYPGGRCSGYLDSIDIGESIHVFGKGGKERNAGSHVGAVAFGVGITEALPVCKAELRKGAEHVHLVWGARTFGDMFWGDELEALERQ